MVTVALVGAASGLGQTVLNSFLRENQTHNQKHKLVVFSRSAKPEYTAKGIDVRAVDYTNHEQLVQNLRDVHTVISLLSGDPSALQDAQLALIKASEEAGVKRFAPSEFAFAYNENIDLYAPKKVILAALEKSKLEWTSFNNGLFMNVFATGTSKPLTAVGKQEGKKTGEEEALGGVRPWKYVVDFENGTAAYPGDGSAPMALTDTRDIGVFVYKALDLEKWPKSLSMRGDVKTWREIVEIAERVQGRKWLTKDRPLEEMRELAKSKEFTTRFYNQITVANAEGRFVVSDELNKAFPDFKPITCEEFITKWWAGLEYGPVEWVEAKQPDLEIK